MTVVEGWFCGEQMSQVPTAEQLTPDVHLLLSSNCALNAKAFLVDQPTGTCASLHRRFCQSCDFARCNALRVNTKRLIQGSHGLRPPAVRMEAH